MHSLFDDYRATPRAKALGPTIFANVRKAWLWTAGTFAGAMVLGAPLSLFHFRKLGSTAVYRPWAPSDILIAGLILVIFTVPIPAALAVIFGRYVNLFRTGRLVEGTVVSRAGDDAIVQVAVGAGPDLTMVPKLAAPIGTRLPVIVGGLTSSQALTVVGYGDVRRGSLLTAAQVHSVVQIRSGSPA